MTDHAKCPFCLFVAEDGLDELAVHLNACSGRLGHGGTVALLAGHAAEVEQLRQQVDASKRAFGPDGKLVAVGRQWASDAHYYEKRLTRCEQELVEARAEVETLRQALGDACDVAVWMSGSYDFGPGGGAYGGWAAGGQRDKLHRAMAALAAAQEPGEDPGEDITEPDDPEYVARVREIAATHGFPLSDWTPKAAAQEPPAKGNDLADEIRKTLIAETWKRMPPAKGDDRA